MEREGLSPTPPKRRGGNPTADAAGRVEERVAVTQPHTEREKRAAAEPRSTDKGKGERWDITVELDW